ncbi:hypothetical protein PC123_g21814 [Phytophthora cactorum]|nr:hypothetical protein PC123_g21814 [Phytophthora cactorum]
MEFTFSHVLELLRPLPGFAKCWLWVIFHDQQVELLSIEELFVATTGTGVVGNVIDAHVGLLNDDTFALPQGALLLLEIQGRNRAGNGNTSRVTVVFTQRLKQVRIGNQVLRLLAIPIAFPVTQTRGWSLRLQCSTWSFSLKVQKEYCLNSTQLGS